MEARSIDTLLSLKVTGAIVAPLGTKSEAGLMQNLSDRISIVYLDNRLDNTSPYVGTNNFQSMGLITDYLCRTGARPTYLQMPPINHNTLERQTAYVQTMERLGLQPEVITLGTTRSWRFEDIGYAETMKLLAGPGFPTNTVLCANDRLAIGVMAAACQSGLKIGRDPDCDLRVAGHDDLPGSRYTCPPLTTVAQDVERLGSYAVDILLGRVDDDAEDGFETQMQLEGKLMMP
eukprot:gene35282-41606_t